MIKECHGNTFEYNDILRDSWVIINKRRLDLPKDSQFISVRESGDYPGQLYMDIQVPMAKDNYWYVVNPKEQMNVWRWRYYMSNDSVRREIQPTPSWFKLKSLIITGRVK